MGKDLYANTHVWRHHHVPWYCLPYAEGDHRPGSFHHQDQDHRSPREEVLRLDRRLHPGFPLHLPADVDLQAGVRRVRPLHRPQEVLLSASSSSSRGYILLTYPLIHIPTNIDVIMQIYWTLSHTN